MAWKATRNGPLGLGVSKYPSSSPSLMISAETVAALPVIYCTRARGISTSILNSFKPLGDAACDRSMSLFREARREVLLDCVEGGRGCLDNFIQRLDCSRSRQTPRFRPLDKMPSSNFLDSIVTLLSHGHRQLHLFAFNLAAVQARLFRSHWDW